MAVDVFAILVCTQEMGVLLSRAVGGTVPDEDLFDRVCRVNPSGRVERGWVLEWRRVAVGRGATVVCADCEIRIDGGRTVEREKKKESWDELPLPPLSFENGIFPRNFSETLRTPESRKSKIEILRRKRNKSQFGGERTPEVLMRKLAFLPWRREGFTVGVSGVFRSRLFSVGLCDRMEHGEQAIRGMENISEG